MARVARGRHVACGTGRCHLVKPTSQRVPEIQGDERSLRKSFTAAPGPGPRLSGKLSACSRVCSVTDAGVAGCTPSAAGGVGGAELGRRAEAPRGQGRGPPLPGASTSAGADPGRLSGGEEVISWARGQHE